MGKFESKLYRLETTIFILVASLMALNFIVALISGVGDSLIVIILTPLIGFFSVPFWILRNHLNRHKPRNIALYTFALIMTRLPLYFLIFCSFSVNCYIPKSIGEARKYRIRLKQARIDHRFLCQYINGEAPIDNGIWVYRYIDTHRRTYRGRRLPSTQIDFTAAYKNRQLHGMAKEDHGDRVVEKYYTNGQLDSTMLFRREFRGRNRQSDTLIFKRVMIGELGNSSTYYYLNDICNNKKD